MTLVAIEGRVIPGHRVASGLNGDPRFPEGTIRPQLPFFRAAIAGFDTFFGEGGVFAGTVNVALPGKISIVAPEIRLAQVLWTDRLPPENFFLSRGELLHRGRSRPCLLYIPDPATKPDHIQDAATLELLTAHIADLTYGDLVEVRYRPEAIAVTRASA